MFTTDTIRLKIEFRKECWFDSGQDAVTSDAKLASLVIVRSCPLPWCSWRRVTAFAGESRAGQLAIAGRLTVGSSLNGAMVSSVM